MQISTKGRYALRVMLDLAEHSGGKPVSIKDMAGRQLISEKYLEQILALLNKAGMVKSIRGAQGGYVLSREPRLYTIGEILRGAEGNLSVAPCLMEEKDGCAKNGACETVILYKKINEAVSSVVDHMTLQDLIDESSVVKA